MFGARNDDGWRLCHRKGRTIKVLNRENFPIDIRFRSQAKAKACADELNEVWKPYWKVEKKQEAPGGLLLATVIAIIERHGGVNHEDASLVRRASGV